MPAIVKSGNLQEKIKKAVEKTYKKLPENWIEKSKSGSERMLVEARAVYIICMLDIAKIRICDLAESMNLHHATIHHAKNNVAMYVQKEIELVKKIIL